MRLPGDARPVDHQIDELAWLEVHAACPWGSPGSSVMVSEETEREGFKDKKNRTDLPS